jgi:hypothetical protein
MDEIVWKKLENLEMAGLAETAEKLLPPLALLWQFRGAEAI